jgi:GxxExxY protein
VVELKSVSEINPDHKAQLLTYMKLLKSAKGILINFNCFNLFKEGQLTMVNEYFNQLPKF